jgi:hypothetical protein
MVVAFSSRRDVEAPPRPDSFFIFSAFRSTRVDWRRQRDVNRVSSSVLKTLTRSSKAEVSRLAALCLLCY